ncbi:hypothetical protein M0R72_21865 [Candidatus Pacearchaeota archaeon]|jgi:hypothetical protein|nr:hypothetical protein [Candidatus Pacearchaeota archaeon]
MTYTPTEWASDTPFTPELFNHIETQADEITSDLATHDAAGHLDRYYTEAEMQSYFWHDGNDGDGSTLNADALGGSHATAIQSGAPSGLMIFWNPNIALSAGWVFCDGAEGSGTYDMRSRFPIGASGTLSVGAAIGNATITLNGDITVAAHTLTTEEIYHTHNYSDQSAITAYIGSSGGGATQYTARITDNIITSYVGGGQSHTHPGTFTGVAYDNLPIYKYLSIVMKS